MIIIGETVDNYLGYHYYVTAVTDKSRHKEPYVAVDDKTDSRVARIKLRDKSIHFYSHTPSEVINDINILKTWIDKNYIKSVKAWNRNNPKYALK